MDVEIRWPVQGNSKREKRKNRGEGREGGENHVTSLENAS